MRRTRRARYQEGAVEQRGASVRIIHYEWIGGKRVFAKHTIKNGNSMGTMGTGLGTEKPDLAFLKENMEPRAGFGPATAALPRRCPTELGYRGTNLFFRFNCKLRFLTLRHS